MRPSDATPAPFSSNCTACKLLAVPIALAILAIRHTSRLALALVVAAMAVAFVLMLAATPLHAERRHDADLRRIFRDFETSACTMWHTARYCAPRVHRATR